MCRQPAAHQLFGEERVPIAEREDTVDQGSGRRHLGQSRRPVPRPPPCRRGSARWSRPRCDDSTPRTGAEPLAAGFHRRSGVCTTSAAVRSDVTRATYCSSSRLESSAHCTSSTTNQTSCLLAKVSRRAAKPANRSARPMASSSEPGSEARNAFTTVLAEGGSSPIRVSPPAFASARTASPTTPERELRPEEVHAVGPHHHIVGGIPGHGLAQQPGLTDARLAPDHHGLGAPPSRGRHDSPQHCQLPVATDERRGSADNHSCIVLGSRAE